AQTFAEDIVNNGFYNWIVPDDRNTTTRVRVVDSSDPDVWDSTPADFTIDYYSITWEMRDLLTNKHLDQMSVSCTSGWIQGGILSPITHDTPYGAWQATWSRVEYGDRAVNYVADSDKTVQEFMETNVVHIWKDEITVAYDASSDTLTVESILTRDGSAVPGPVSNEINIYDGGLVLMNDTDLVPDGLGFFKHTWGTPTGLVSGKTYQLVSTTELASGGIFNTPTTFSITEAASLQQVADTVNSKLDISLSEARDDIVDEVKVKLEEGQQAIEDTLDQFQQDVQVSITSLEEAADRNTASAAELELAADNAQEAAHTLEEIAIRQAAQLLLPQSVITGSPATFQYRNLPDLQPVMDILDEDGNSIYEEEIMSPVEGKPGLYSFTIERILTTEFAPGQAFTVIVNEPETGSLESGAVFCDVAPGRILAPNSVLIGDKMQIRFRGQLGWQPKITIKDFEDQAVVDDQIMQLVAGSTELYEFTIEEIRQEDFKPGKPATMTVVETLTGTTETDVFIVESTSLTSLQGLISSGLGAKEVAQDALSAIRSVEFMLGRGGDIGGALEALKSTVAQLPKKAAEEGGSGERLSNQITEISDKLNALAGEEGFDFSSIIGTAIENSESITDIRRKSEKIQGASEVMQLIMENKLGGVDDPVVHVLFE
ncbi:MAG: hypothetical protein JW937_07360, partial [Candidatus Omnitrophica bacterium]|nr:hypothetical protein [Candidatus Omnitrophota bacterium]